MTQSELQDILWHVKIEYLEYDDHFWILKNYIQLRNANLCNLGLIYTPICIRNHKCFPFDTWTQWKSLAQCLLAQTSPSLLLLHEAFKDFATKTWILNNTKIGLGKSEHSHPECFA